ncbi:MAG: hypothetical protein WCD04_15650 [Terriglobia bacterium]
MAATVVSNGLWPLLVLRLLGALRLLVLRLLGALRLLALRLLGALRLRLLGALLRLGFLRTLLWLRLLGALLRLRFLRLLRLRLVLRLLGFSSALFLLALLCECRNGGSEK